MVSTTHYNGSKVIYARRFEMNRNRYPKETYFEFVSFCRDMNRADKQKLILVREEQE